MDELSELFSIEDEGFQKKAKVIIRTKVALALIPHDPLSRTLMGFTHHSI